MFKIVFYDDNGKRVSQVQNIDLNTARDLYEQAVKASKPRPTLWDEDTEERIYGF